MKRLRAWWTRLRGGTPCYVCGRRALTGTPGWYSGREEFIHAEHLIHSAVNRSPRGDEREDA